MFDPALEYRKYIQKPRTASEKDSKLIALALKFKARSKSNRPYQEFIHEIARDFKAGTDILSPDIFPKEDIIEWAKENKVENDSTVLKFVEMAQPRSYWE